MWGNQRTFANAWKHSNKNNVFNKVNNEIMAIIEDTYVCNSVVLAKYIAGYANVHHFVINMTKIQKLLYITYGVFLAVTGERLTNEHPQAWPYGPVFSTTRNKLLKLSLEEIQMPDDKTINDEVKSCVALVFKSFGKYNASYLSSWSHQIGSPWEETTAMEDFKWGDVIPDEFIFPYFKSMIINKNDHEKQ